MIKYQPHSFNKPQVKNLKELKALRKREAAMKKDPIQAYYEKELKEIQQAKREKNAFEMLDPANNFQRIKDEILIKSERRNKQ